MAAEILVVAISLDEVHARMWNELVVELQMDSRTLAQHAIASLWISVHLQRAAERLK